MARLATGGTVRGHPGNWREQREAWGSLGCPSQVFWHVVHAGGSALLRQQLALGFSGRHLQQSVLPPAVDPAKCYTYRKTCAVSIQIGGLVDVCLSFNWYLEEDPTCDLNCGACSQKGEQQATINLPALAIVAACVKCNVGAC